MGTEKMKIDSIAYHEAGHGVIAYRFNHEARDITLIAHDEILGSSSSEGEWFDGSTDREQIIVLYAGFAAEFAYDDNSSRLGSRTDDEKARELLKLQPSGSKEELQDEAIRLVKRNWSSIEAVAQALLEFKTLPWDEWTIIIDSIDEGSDWRENLQKLRAIKQRDKD
jgi:ATP-dependent Zn protease